MDFSASFKYLIRQTFTLNGLLMSILSAYCNFSRIYIDARV